MDWKLEVVVVPVTDVDRAKSFYVDKLGFHLDADIQPRETCGWCTRHRRGRPARWSSAPSRSPRTLTWR